MNIPVNSQQLNSFLASLTAGTSSTTSSTSATTTTPRSPSTLKTLTSVTDGSTFFITSTIGAGDLPTSNPSESTANALHGQQSKSNGAPLGAIIGGVIGGVSFLLALLLLLFFLRRRKRLREQRRATLPPLYQESGDMSEQLGAGATLTSDSKPKETAVSDDTATSESTPQLDSNPIIPSVEANVDAVGNIPELPATGISRRNSDPFCTPGSSVEGEGEPPARVEHVRGDPDNHVMSWSQYNSMGNREPSSRLSQPHTAPDASTSVWENMSPKKKSSE